MIPIGVRINARQVEEQIDAELRQFEGEVASALWDAVDGAAAQARQTRLFRDRTGKLRASIRSRARSLFVASVEARRPYASFVHNGTAPHVIEARGGGMLRFVANGQTVFRRRVNHPGTAARPFVQNAVDAAAGPLAQRIAAIAERTFQ